MLEYWLWLTERPGLTLREKLELLEHFHTPEDVYFAKQYPDSISIEGKSALQDKDLSEARRILAQCRRRKIQLITLQDETYPDRLKNIYDPPIVLYCKGNLPKLDELPVIGVVGTRKASAYGLNIAKKLSGEIAASGAVVVSGMAMGVDAMATCGALETAGYAVGVLGCGVDRAYPACNLDLFRRMERDGCLLSEYPPGTKPDKWNFPRRNRIISGLSCGVLVVEAPAKSGSLITARQALEQGRDVFVVPGNIDVDTFAGSNSLLRDGGIAVSSAWDVMSEYEGLYPQVLRKQPQREEKPAVDKITVDNGKCGNYSWQENNFADLTQDEQIILQQITGEQLVDTVIAGSGLSTSAAMAALTMLEIKGAVTTLPGGRVIRN